MIGIIGSGTSSRNRILALMSMFTMSMTMCEDTTALPIRYSPRPMDDYIPIRFYKGCQSRKKTPLTPKQLRKRKASKAARKARLINR